MSDWRILTNAQAEADYERMELQILQLQSALVYLDHAALSDDSRWFVAAAKFARGVRAESFDRALMLSATPWQKERLQAACCALDARLDHDACRHVSPDSIASAGSPHSGDRARQLGAG
jgi:hypothetical protein